MWNYSEKEWNQQISYVHKEMIFCFFPAVLTIQFSITIWGLDVLCLEIMVYFFFLK